MFCPKCGTSNEGSNYCRSCGANLTRVAKVISDPELNRSYAAKRESGTSLGIFYATEVTNEGRDLNGHNAGAVFGGVKIDLTKMPLAVGDTRINLFAVFGGVEVIVPDDVALRITGVTIFGGTTARGKTVGAMFAVHNFTTPGYEQAARRLHIDATTVFGGIEIKDQNKK